MSRYPLSATSDARSLPENPFQQLRELLRDVACPEDTIKAHVGDPQSGSYVPTDIIADHARFWSRYPPLVGTQELRAAIMSWLERRHRLEGSPLLDHLEVIPTSGTREALFFGTALGMRIGGGKNFVAIPDPSYPGYIGSALVAGGMPVPMPVLLERGFMPDFSSLSEEVLDRLAVAFLTNPSNPEGAAAPPDYLESVVRLSQKHNFLLIVDECCLDLYTSSRPVGVLEVCGSRGLGIETLLVVNSLSKRSYAAGLRSGFVTGDPELLGQLRAIRSYCAPTVPTPIQAASALLWSDEDHVTVIRNELSAKFDLAEDYLGDMYPAVRPDAGFFMWLPVQDDLTVSRSLAKRGLMVMPGTLLSRIMNGSAGRNYIRVAMVHDLATSDRMLRCLSSELRQ